MPRINLSLLRPNWVLPMLALVVAFVLSEGFYQTKVFSRVENLYTDFWHQLSGKRYVPDKSALVLIDEYSLSRLADTPLTFWTPYIAKVIGALRDNGAMVVGLDLLISATAEQWLRRFENMPASVQNYDQPLREQINKGKVVLVAPTQQLKSGVDSFVLPIPDVLFSLPDLDNTAKYIGVSDLVADADGVYRRYQSWKPLNLSPEEREHPPVKYTFAALLALHAKFFSADSVLARDNQKETQPIVFAGPPGTIPKISFYPLLSAIEALPPGETALPSEFQEKIRGKVVIIGSDYVGLNDIHTTPYGVKFFDQLAQPMSGPEIQANIVETILGERQLATISWQWRYGVFLIIFGIVAFIFRFAKNTLGIVTLIGSSAIVALIGYGAFYVSLLFPVATIQIGILLIFVSVYGLRFFGETRKRQHLQAMFGRYVSKEVVSQLMETNETPPLGGVSYDVTVMFSDIRNFTSLSEILQPHEVVEFINEYLSRAVPRVEQHFGNIDKFIGDAIMAEFGAPVKRADHALCGLRAAVLMKQNAENFRIWFHSRFPQLHEFEFSIGIGINTGAAIMGNIGSLEKREYTALGDTVNIASRLESATKQLGWTIVASDATVKAAGDAVITGGCEQISVKGRREPILVHEILGVK